MVRCEPSASSSDKPGNPHRVSHLLPAICASALSIRNTANTGRRIRGKDPDQDVRYDLPLFSEVLPQGHSTIPTDPFTWGSRVL